MSDIRKLLDLLNETTAGCVSSVAQPLLKQTRESEDSTTDGPEVIQYGNWENSALTTSNKHKESRTKSPKVQKSIYSEGKKNNKQDLPEYKRILSPEEERLIARKREIGLLLLDPATSTYSREEKARIAAEKIQIDRALAKLGLGDRIQEGGVDTIRGVPIIPDDDELEAIQDPKAYWSAVSRRTGTRMTIPFYDLGFKHGKSGATFRSPGVVFGGSGNMYIDTPSMKYEKGYKKGSEERSSKLSENSSSSMIKSGDGSEANPFKAATWADISEFGYQMQIQSKRIGEPVHYVFNGVGYTATPSSKGFTIKGGTGEIIKQGVAEGADDDDEYSDEAIARWKKQQEFEREYNKKKPANSDNKNKEQGVAEGSKKIPASNKPVDPKDLVVSLKDVPVKKPRGHKQYDPAKEFPGVKAFQKKDVAEGYIDSLNASLLTELGKLDRLSEQDLIISRGAITARPRDLVSRHQDHEISMAKNELYQASKNALDIFNLIKDRGEGAGLDAWVQSKITKAEDYLSTVRKYLEGKQLESLDGVAPSTKMFAEEEVDENIWDNIRKRQKSGKPPRKPGQEGAPSEKDWKIARSTAGKNESAGDGGDRRSELIKLLAGELDLGTAELHLLSIDELEELAKDIELKESCSRCGGRTLSNLIISEKVDACYRKVKSRYKVWPSAYASGALVKCRKVGSKNWGNKGKK